jgi:pilus assembly protein FimV
MKRKKLPADQAMRASTSSEKPLWRTTALAVATAVLFGFSASDARALALGRITVQSALGEPLRAEIDIPEIDADEVASLRANVAAPDAFKSAGFDYNPTLTGIRITLEKRADGRYFLRLVSPRPVNDPFVDLILESSWSSGRVVRDYTMLFDPPITRQAQPLSAELPPSAPAGRAATPAPDTAATPASPGTAAAPASPGTAAATPAPASTAAATPASPGTADAAPASPGTADATPASPGTPDATPATPAAVASVPPTSSPASAPRAPGGEGNKQVTVRSGDTAGKIAGANKPANVSLDQMLVAMLRSNPDAFAEGNINRLRSGAVLDMPSAEDAALVPTDEAKQLLVAQSRDFNEFRRRLAESVPAKQVTPADRQASGKITAQVEEKRPAASAPDKLTLSKGSVQSKSGAEEKIAHDRASQDTATRVAELNKNITDLGKLGKSSAAPATPASAAKGGLPVPVGAPATTGTAAASALKSPAPAVPPAPAALASAPAPVAKASAATSPAPAASPAPTAASSAVAASAAAPAVAPVLIPASAAAPAASQAAPAASAASAAASSGQPAVAAKPASAAKPAAKPVPPPPEPSLIDELVTGLEENWPIAAGGIGAIIALVAGVGFYRARQRKKNAQVDSSFLESRLQPDSFFGASGGQRIDTNEGGVSGSSLVYSPSQLDAAGDVDPVAEADVYLAYGRDLQAEEILKEAMRTQPQRVAIHVKLLEIYAKRRDTRAFELVATEAYSLTHGSGSEWERICELGKELDSSNSLYRPGGEPGAPGPKSAPAPVAAAAPTSAMRTQPMAAAPAAAAVVPQPEPEPAADIDLDLDFSLGDEPAAPQVAAPVSKQTQPVQATSAELMPALDMDFGSTQATAAQPARLDAPDLTLNENSLNFDLSAPPTPAAAAPAAPTATAASADSGMLEFDLGGLSLDLGTPASKAAAAASEPDTEAPIITAGAPLSTGEFEDSSGDPLATKFALAKEFHSIGDPDGARSLAQEVLAEASGELKAAAQRFLAEVG